MAKKGFYKDISGQQYNHLFVIRHIENTKRGAKFLCRCRCGREVSLFGHNIRSNYSKSCGKCIKRKPRKINIKPLVNIRFGNLVVKEYNGCGSKHMWKCQCDCGGQKTISESNLINGATKSCGCKNESKKWTGEKRRTEMIGKKSHYLEVLEFSGVNKHRSAMWKCLCHRCGKYKIINGQCIRRKSIMSCGCLLAKKNYKIFTYKNECYRSGYELLTVLIFEKMGIKFEYEPQCFRFLINGKIKRYTPDFYLPDFQLWVEVKGYINPKSIEKYNLFSKQHKCILFNGFNLEQCIGISLNTFYNKWRKNNFDTEYAKSFIQSVTLPSLPF